MAGKQAIARRPQRIGGRESTQESRAGVIEKFRRLCGPTVQASWRHQCFCGSTGAARYRGRYWCVVCGREFTNLTAEVADGR